MKDSMTYSEARTLFDAWLKTEYLRHHSRETEVIMRALARHLNRDETLWGITGLLHDLDLDDLGEDLSLHGRRTLEILREAGYEIPEMFQAILAHVEGMEGVSQTRTSDFDYILAGAENITGIITAYVILRPDKKIEGVNVKSVLKKFRSPAFAAKVNREYILDAAEHAGMELSDFVQLSIDAMKSIAGETGM